MASWLVRNWYLIAFVACLTAAWLAPAFGAAGSALHPEVMKPALISAIFLMCGLSLPTRTLYAAIGRIRVHAFIQFFSLALIPLLLLAGDQLWGSLGLPPPLRTGLLLAACLPTTISTCVALTRISGGDEATAVCNSTIGNLLGIVLTPLLVLAVTGRHATLPAHVIFTQLATMVVLPLVIGQLVRAPLEQLVAGWRSGFAIATSLLLLSLVYLVFCDSFAGGTPIGAGPLVGVCLLVSLLYPLLMLISFTMSSWAVLGMSRPERIAATICATHKTAVLGVPMLSIIYAGDPQLPLLTTPLLIYHFLQLFTGSALAPTLRAWAQDEHAESPTSDVRRPTSEKERAIR
ncbi:MAG: bile acid:sodium symporter [Planctomycetes bacterium]|nr:bile acid:sodium symporter [Planctomycetota bacterium]